MVALFTSSTKSEHRFCTVSNEKLKGGLVTRLGRGHICGIQMLKKWPPMQRIQR